MRIAIALFVATVGPAHADEWTPSEADIAVHKALSARHDTVPCDDLEALTDTPVETLSNVVAHATAPPWAPMRAAKCLVENHAVEVEGDLVDWVTDPAWLGLGKQTLNLLDRMPEPIALRVAGAALDKGDPELGAADRIGRAASPAVKALVNPAVSEPQP